jgi:dihydrodipicolinate synthase/N-acetylneuraminate lyase
MLLEGLHLPVTTPFYADGRLNLLKLEYNVARYSKTAAAGLAVLGSVGEPSLLSEEETRQVLRGAIEAASPEKVMLAGVARDSVAGTLKLAEVAARLGYDAVLVKPPSILQAADDAGETEMLTYFQCVADRSPLPVIVANGSGSGNAILPADLVVRLARSPQIIGVVQSASEVEEIRTIQEGTAYVRREVSVTTVFRPVTARMRSEENAMHGGLISAGTLTGGGTALTVMPVKTGIKTRTKIVGFQMLAGSTVGMLEGLMAGAVGVMPAFSASAPQACYEVVAAWKDGDEGLAREKQERLVNVARRVEEELGIAGVKYGCDLNGYYGGWPRLPLLPLTGQERADIEELMLGLRS